MSRALATTRVQYYRKNKGLKPDLRNMKRNITILVLLTSLATTPLLFSTGCAVAQHRETMGQNVQDKEITAKVKTALIGDPGVKASEVNVTTF